MLLMCGMTYMVLSVWGIVQMLIMGISYSVEATSLIHDTEAEEFEDVQDFIKKTRENYSACARNCFIAAALYALVLLSTLLCIKKARSDEKKREAAMQDDALLCSVEEKELTEKQKRKIQ